MKKHNTLSKNLLRTFCILGFIATVVILAAALYVQMFMDEQPCPLCLLQRAAFASMAIGLLMNLRYRESSAHWAVVILSACAGLAVSIRQICLHITNPKGFGSAFLGLHMYTWCFIGFSITIIGSALILLIYSEEIQNESHSASGT